MNILGGFGFGRGLFGKRVGFAKGSICNGGAIIDSSFCRADRDYKGGGGKITTGGQDLRPKPPTQTPVFDQILGCEKMEQTKWGVKLPDCCVITVPANTPSIHFKGM